MSSPRVDTDPGSAAWPAVTGARGLPRDVNAVSLYNIMGMSRGHHLSPATLTNMKLLLIIGKSDQQPRSPQGLSKSEIESKKAHLDCMWSFDKRMLPDKPEMTKKNREANISYAN